MSPRTVAADTIGDKVQTWLPVLDLRVDESYQRPLDNVRVRKIAQDFDPEAVGTIEVSMRPDGATYIIDGQHRVAALKLNQWTDQKVPCLVHRGLTVEDEARIFRLRNTAARPTSIAMFRAELAEGRPEAVAIDRTVRTVGMEIIGGTTAGTIQAVSAVRRIYQLAGAEVLERTLRVILLAWGNASTNFQADMLLSLSLMQKRYGDHLDRDRLSKVMEAGATPAKLMAAARATKLSGSGAIWADALPEQLVELYNKGLRRPEAKLPAWERRTNVREVWS